MLAEEQSVNDFLGACLWAFVTVVVVVLVFLWVSYLRYERERRATEAAKAEKLRQQKEREREKTANEREVALAEEYRQKQEETERAAERAIEKAVTEIRATAEERFRKGLEANGYEELDTRVREALLIFGRSGRVLSVRVFAVPTGYMALEWALAPNLPQPLKVTCERNGKLVFVEHAYKGVYGDLLRRGKEYTFIMHAYDGKRDQEDDFVFVVRAPTPAQWKRIVGPAEEVDDESKRQQEILKRIERLAAEDELWASARLEAHKRIDATDASDIEKRKRKAAFDAKLLEERERDEGDGG